MISQISKYSVFLMLRIHSIDFSLNGLNFWFLSKFQSGEPVSSLFLCECHPAFVQLNVVDLVFWNLCYCCGFSRTLQFICSYRYRHGFPSTLHFLCFDGQRMFSLQKWWNPDACDANGLSTALWCNLGDWHTLLRNFSPVVLSFCPTTVCLATWRTPPRWAWWTACWRSENLAILRILGLQDSVCLFWRFLDFYGKNVLLVL